MGGAGQSLTMVTEDEEQQVERLQTHIVSDKSRSQRQLQTVQREGLGHFRRGGAQCTDTLRPCKQPHPQNKKKKIGKYSGNREKKEEEESGERLSDLGGRGGGEGGGADLLGVLNSCEGAPVLLIGSPASKTNGFEGQKDVYLKVEEPGAHAAHVKRTCSCRAAP